MTNLTIGGETFNVRIEGDTALPVVVLSHALGADLHLWDDQMPGLLEHFRVVRYDARGHGGSVAGVGPVSIKRLGEDALAILDALDLDKVHWIGLSMGGLVGQWMLVNAPDRIERAVLANTAAHFGPADVWNERIVTARTDGLATLAEGTLARWFSPGFARKNPERVEAVEKTFLATPPTGYAAACAALRDADLREDLRRIDHPVLVIAGLEDPSIAPAQTSLLAETIPNATLVTINARHISNIEAAEAFNKATLNFLTGKLARRPKKRATTPPLPAPRRPAGRRSPTTRGTPVEARTKRAPVPVATVEKLKAAPARATAPKAAKTKLDKAKVGRVTAKTTVKAAPPRKATQARNATPAKKATTPATSVIASKPRSAPKPTAKPTTKPIAPVRAKAKQPAIKPSAKAASAIKKPATKKPVTKKEAAAKATVATARAAVSRTKTVAARKPKVLPVKTKIKAPVAKTATVKPAASKQPVKKSIVKPKASRRT